MTAATAFTLRPLERNTPANALEGAFRVHLSIKELKNLGLYAGDLLRLSTSEGPKGLAVAWLANQTNPGNKPIAKVTDLLRELYDLSLNDRVFIEKATLDAKPFDHVEVSFQDSKESTDSHVSTEELTHRIRSSLGNELDLVFAGCTFDVQRKGPKDVQAHTRWRLRVDTVVPTPDANNRLYFSLATSKIIFANTKVTQSAQPVDDVFQINSDGIGGLSGQIKAINNKLRLQMDPPYLQDRKNLGPFAILIHGPQGSGKSLLLERLSACPWRETYKADLLLNTKAPAKELAALIERAVATQPSLILIDELDQLLKKSEDLVKALKSELKTLEGTKVVVAATARSIHDIDSALQNGWTFGHILEILPPNEQQREAILREIVGLEHIPDINFHTLAERTHGFVGGDLYTLCILARRHRKDSIYETVQGKGQDTIREALHTQEYLTMSDFDAVIDEVPPSVLQDSVIQVPKVRWADIAGLEHVQQELESIIIRPLKSPENNVMFGAPPSRKGILLYGPPGCAKTLIAQAMATESNQNFLAVKGSELIKMYVGESERAIRDVFRRARAAKPCIIFFDEIDSIGKSRKDSQDSGLNVVTTLLNEMDGIEALKEVFIMGATNRPDILDSALTRPGRFDAHIHIGLPTGEARKQIFEIHTRKSPLAQDVDLDVLAAKTEGNSGADIKGMCSVAVEKAIADYTQARDAGLNSPPEIRMEHFERSLKKHVPHTLKEEAARYANWRPGMSLSAM
ncbi:AAA-domain-containing protein [Lophiostoma macrostomum CBS 122681]|uniref:AAA-domain-containing protein n=1 Tax=Lophiostoma macrostomum CBS 122681 TaxID=1314788 RepID=A0A6A6T5N1_9PLEO|nr:AAA-domain-containing protein [Lophiostoma macrostomum CBS 122681]